MAFLPDGFDPTLGPPRSPVASRRQSSTSFGPARTAGADMLALTPRGGYDRGRFGPGAATVPFRSSGLSGDPQRPGGGGGGRAESIDRCAAASQPPRKIRFGSAAGVHGPDHGFLNWGSRSVACWIMRRSCQFFAFGSGTAFGWTVSTASACTRGRPWGPCTRTTGLRRATPSRSQESASTLLLTASTRGSRSWPGILPIAGPAYGGLWCIPGSHKSHFKLPRQIHEAPEKASCVVIPDVPAGSVVLFSEAVMHGTAPWRSRPRAPDSALQVLRLPDGVVAGAGPSATRCSAHPATASAPHRAGGSTYVRSVTLQRRTRRGAVEAPQGTRSGRTRGSRPSPSRARRRRTRVG